MFPDLDLTQIWLLSNGTGAVAFAALTVFILFGVHVRHAAFRLLLVACAVTALWFALLAAAPLTSFSGPVLDLVETVRTGIWLVTAAWVLPVDTRLLRHRWLREIGRAHV